MFKKLIKKTSVDVFKKLNWKDGILLAISFFMGVYLKWNVAEIAIFMIFIYIILHPIESRFMAMSALFFLILIPFFLIFKQEIIAEKLAIYCYYFLIMTVVMGIYELQNNNQLKSKNEHEHECIN